MTKEEDHKRFMVSSLETCIEMGTYQQAKVLLSQMKTLILENEYKEYLSRIDVEERDY